MSYSSPMRINNVATIRCTSMRDGVRCVFMQGHSGRHHDGAWSEWNDAGEQVAAKDRCSAVAVAYETGVEVQCELPKGHRSAHRGSDLIWGDPVSLEAPLSKRWGEYPYQG